MNNRLDIDWSRIGKKWVACFDILGFSEFVKGSDLVSIFYRWELCFAQFRNNLQRYPKLDFAHFSDTFLIYAPDDSLGSFGKIESCSRWFFQHTLLYKFPLRGAMAFGEFYADKPNGIFLGKALVEAHEYGAQFNWIGYTLCPSALSRLEQLEVSSSHFRKSDVQTKSAIKEVVALLCGDGKGCDYIAALEEMRRAAFEDMKLKQKPSELIARVMEKYENSIQFIKRFELCNRQDAGKMTA